MKSLLIALQLDVQVVTYALKQIMLTCKDKLGSYMWVQGVIARCKGRMQ